MMLRPSWSALLAPFALIFPLLVSQGCGDDGTGGGGLCVDGTCTTPPAPFCNGETVAVAFDPTGVCNTGGTCDYAARPTNCANQGLICRDGQCVSSGAGTPDAGGDAGTDTGTPDAGSGDAGDDTAPADPCDLCDPATEVCVAGVCEPLEPPACGGPCSAPPTDTCEGDTAILYSATGTCDEATDTCAYPSTRTECSEAGRTCLAGRCVDPADPCAGIACTTPPAPTCDTEGRVVRVSGAGTCNPTTLQCEFAEPTVETCDDPTVCRSGACVDLCAAQPCTPPAASCEGNSVLSYAGAGTCRAADGSCDFSAVQVRTPCAAGLTCRSGACVRDIRAGDVVITEVMMRSKSGSGDNGEWFEIWNAADAAFDLQACTFEYVASSNGSVTPVPVGRSLVIPAGESRFIARRNRDGNADLGDAPTPDFVLAPMGSAFELVNGGGTIRLRCPVGGTDVTIDSVTWSFASTPPIGRAWQLRPEGRTSYGANPGTRNDDPANWCFAQDTPADATNPNFYGNNGTNNLFGTPRAFNRLCPGQELDLCEGVVCTGEGEVCQGGVCVIPEPDPCDGVTCDSGQVCVAGACEALPDSIDPGELVITEIMMRSRSGADEGEWFEVWNATGSTLDLEGCALEYVTSGGTVTSTPVTRSLRVAGGSSLFISRRDPATNAAAATDLGDAPAPDFVVAASGGTWGMNNTGASIRIQCPDAGGTRRLIDNVTWSFSATPTEGRAWQLRPQSPGSYGTDPAAANDDPASWCFAWNLPADDTNPNFFGSNGTNNLFGTPGEFNQPCTPVVPDPCASVTCGADEVCEDGLCVPDGTIDLCEGITCPAPLPSCDGDDIVSYSGNGTCVAETGVCDFSAVTVIAACPGTNVCSEGFCVAPPAPFALGDLAITELMIQSRSGTDEGEWFEVYNTSDKTLDLRPCAFEYVTSGGTVTSTPVNRSLRVDPGATLLITRRNPATNATAATELALAPAPDFVLAPTGGTWGMNNSGASIRIQCPVSGELTLIDNVTWTSAWVSLGRSLQLIPADDGTYGANPAAANDNRDNWCFTINSPADATNAWWYGNNGVNNLFGSPGVTNPRCNGTVPGEVDPLCVPNPCTLPPASTCGAEPDAVINFASPGTCTAFAGSASCDYAPFTVTCAAGEVCDEGACVAPADPCEGVVCPGTQVCQTGTCVEPGVTPDRNVAVGEVLFTEVMMRSISGTDNGEWFEVYNATDRALDLSDCRLYDLGLADSSVPAQVAGRRRLTGVILQPGAYAVFTQRDPTAQPAVNRPLGSILSTFVYGPIPPGGTGTMDLGNTGGSVGGQPADALLIECISGVVDGEPVFTLVNRIEWQFTSSPAAGRSWQLRPTTPPPFGAEPGVYNSQRIDNSTTHWCLTTQTPDDDTNPLFYGNNGGNNMFGTPGRANVCPAF